MLSTVDSVSFGDAFADVRPIVRRGIRRYWRARLDYQLAEQATDWCESELYTLFLGWLDRGAVSANQVSTPALWFSQISFVASAWWREQRPVVDGSPLAAIPFDIAEAVRADVSSEDDAEQVLTTLCRAYASGAGVDRAPLWVMSTLAIRLVCPHETRRDYADHLGVSLETYRTRMRKIRRAIAG